jgi:hypothetical protein
MSTWDDEPKLDRAAVDAPQTRRTLAPSGQIWLISGTDFHHR